MSNSVRYLRRHNHPERDPFWAATSEMEQSTKSAPAANAMNDAKRMTVPILRSWLWELYKLPRDNWLSFFS